MITLFCSGSNHNLSGRTCQHFTKTVKITTRVVKNVDKIYLIRLLFVKHLLNFINVSRYQSRISLTALGEK